jgi:L-ribulose-5-phosphate 4-epimerase
MFKELRQEVFECLLELPKNRLVTMSSGTISGRDPESNLVVIKPSGFRYDKLTPSDLLVVDLDGKIIEGTLNPSSDTGTHLYLYRERTNLVGIVHTHSVYANVFGILGKPIPPCITSAALIGGEIPLGGYVPVGGDEIGEEILAKIGTSNAIVMQSHGVYTISDSSVYKATVLAAEVEEIAKIAHLAMLQGQPTMLTSEQVEEFQEIYNTLYGN